MLYNEGRGGARSSLYLWISRHSENSYKHQGHPSDSRLFNWKLLLSGFQLQITASGFWLHISSVSPKELFRQLTNLLNNPFRDFFSLLFLHFLNYSWIYQFFLWWKCFNVISPQFIIKHFSRSGPNFLFSFFCEGEKTTLGKEYCIH